MKGDMGDKVFPSRGICPSIDDNCLSSDRAWFARLTKISQTASRSSGMMNGSEYDRMELTSARA